MTMFNSFLDVYQRVSNVATPHESTGPAVTRIFVGGVQQLRCRCVKIGCSSTKDAEVYWKKTDLWPSEFLNLMN